MRDRTPTKMIEQGDGAGAIRYAEYNEETGELIGYRYLKPADEPTDTGTPLTKQTLLTDETEVNLFGNAADRTVNEALNHIGARLYQIAERVASISVTVKDSGGHPIPNILVSGIVDDMGNAMYTDANGAINGYIAEGTQTISITKYADVEDYSETLEVLSGGAYTKNIVVTTRNFIRLTSSASYRFSGNVATVDVSVGGGGGGGASSGASDTQSPRSGGGGGGGGGQCTVQTAIVPNHNVMYAAVVGAGGIGGKSYYDSSRWFAGAGAAGGASSFMGVSAGGGSGGGWVSGGYGNGNGGNGPYDEDMSADGVYARRGDNGNAGSKRLYTSFADSVVFGGGGGGGGLVKNSSYADGKSSGAGYGGDGGSASQTISQYVAATAGQDGFGGGGGGGSLITGNTFNGANGGSGSVSFRMHLKSA